MDIKQFESTFQLIGSSVTDLKVNNTLKTIVDEETLNHEISVTYGIVQRIKTENQLFGVLNLTVDAQLRERKKKGKKISVRLQEEGLFSADNTLDTDTFEKMLRVNGTASLFSIARAFIMSLTSQMLISGKIVIPLVNFHQMEEIASQPNEET